MKQVSKPYGEIFRKTGKKKGANTMMYYDYEHNSLCSEEDLRKCFLDLKESGETEAETFSDYIRNCTEKNGTLSQALKAVNMEAVGMTYNDWISSGYSKEFDECIGFYRDGSEIWFVPDNVGTFRILGIYTGEFHCVAYIVFDAERK